MKTYNGGTGPLANDIIAAAQASNGFVLELGVHTGNGSTAMFQEALETHHSPLHISVDWEDLISPEHRPTVPWWHLVRGDTSDPRTAIDVIRICAPRNPGVIFIDTDHNYAQMKAELLVWGPLADDSTVWLFHDVMMYGPENVEMVRAIKEYAAANGWTYDVPRLDSHGLGRMRRA